MREVLIEKKTFTVRSLRRKEMREHNLAQYGITPSMFTPVMKEDGKTVDVELHERGQEKVIDLVLDDQGGVDAVDQAGGNAGLRDVWIAIVKETYGAVGEEKNLPTSGGGAQTGSASTIAPPAPKPSDNKE